MGKLTEIRLNFHKATHLIPALRLVWQASAGWSLAQILLMLMQGILPLAQIYLAKLIVDVLTLTGRQPSAETSGPHLIQLVVLLGLVLLANNVLSILERFVSEAQSYQFMDYMSEVVHRKSIEIDLAFYENPDYHDTLERAQDEATWRPNQVLQNLIALTQNLISLVLMGGLLITLHWGIALVVLVAAIPTLWVRMQDADNRYQWHRRRTSVERQANYLSWLMIGDTHAKEVRLFGLGPLFGHRFNRLRQLLYREMLAIGRRFMLTSILSQGLSTLLTIGAYSYVVYCTFQGRLSIGDLVLYYQALQRGQHAFSGLMSSLSAIYEDSLFLNNLFEFLQLQPQITSPLQPVPTPNPMVQGIVFEGVNFEYGGTPRQALHDIHLQVRPGEIIALVGENGSGKTTLIKLLCRLYEPTSGRITLDGIDLRNFKVTDLRQQISVIFQDYVKYFLTARENIWLGNVELPLESDLIPNAALQSGADAIIQSLPHQYETMLGKWFDEGEELSIGQWQKVALARAFLRESQLIVLDEPTSAMDPKAEYEVFCSFRNLIHNQSAILISHRLSTIKMADRIYLMDQGRIVESGTHAELMKHKGHYATLFEIQAQSYR